jgi:aconitate hydratase
VDDATLKQFALHDVLYIPNIRRALENGAEEVEAYLLNAGKKDSILLRLPNLAQTEREIILAGCLINYYRGQ